MFHAFDDFLVRRKHYPAFLSDHFIAYPDGKFASFAFDQIGLDTEFFFDFRCRPDSAWTIRRSDFAKPDSHIFHNFNLQFILRFLQSLIFHCFSFAGEQEKPDTAFFAQFVRRRCRWKYAAFFPLRRVRASPT